MVVVHMSCNTYIVIAAWLTEKQVWYEEINIKPNSLKYRSHNKRTHLLSDTSMPIHCKQNSLDTKVRDFVINSFSHTQFTVQVIRQKGIKHVTNKKIFLTKHHCLIKTDWLKHELCVLNKHKKMSDLETAFQNEQKESRVMTLSPQT